MTCFICGREYDPNNREVAVEIENKLSHKVIEINKVISSSGLTLKLCKYCVKAMTYGYILPINYTGLYRIIESIKYEEEEKVML